MTGRTWLTVGPCHDRVAKLSKMFDITVGKETPYYALHCPVLKLTCVAFLTFIVPCIIIYLYSKTNQMHQFLTFIYFCITLHVSDGLSVHHQELKTVHIPVAVCTVLNS
jgi:hypothetical protein